LFDLAGNFSRKYEQSKSGDKRMKKYSTLLSVLTTLFVVSITLAMATRRSQPQTKSTALQQTQNQRDIEKVPVADYYPSGLSNDRSYALRSAKSSRYDNRDNIIELPEGIERTPDFVDWYRDIPSIPSAQSDVIVIAQVQSANAFLSNDRNYVYSEFTLAVTDVLKNNSRSSINTTTIITAEREGGAVKFPSGRIQQYRINGQGMPQIERKYVFFLRQNETDEDFSILTAYELRDGQVFPLDTLDLYAIYRGDEASQFLDMVRKTAK
jgi:hypothetical protein